MKKFRKYFNSPSKAEEKLIVGGCEKLDTMAKEEAKKHYDKEHEYKRRSDSSCPKCHGEEVVDKIARVEGSGSVSGSFYLGSGSIWGRSSMDTNEVNHCNKCGNQWKKYEIKYKWEDKIIADWVNDINTVYEGKYAYGDKTIELLKDIPAESIFREALRNSDKLYYSTRGNISLKYLRTKFKSVYD